MADERTPKAWLPVLKFADDFALKYEALLIAVNGAGKAYKLRIWERNGDKYRLALTAKVSPSNSETNQAVIEIAVSKTHQSSMNAEALSDANFKRTLNTSSVWIRTMAGRPSEFALANHTLAGIEFSVGLKRDMGFEFETSTPESQKVLEDTLKARGSWKRNGTTNIHFLAN
jgi:hypothetical protein